METTAATASPPSPAPAPPPKKRKRRALIIIAVAALLLIAAPVGYYFVDRWIGDRALEAIYSEIDAEDPNWRWHDLIAEIKIPPDEENSVVQVRKAQALHKKAPFLPGPKWDNGPQNFLDQRNARLSPEYENLLSAALRKLDPELLKEARKLKDMPNGALPIEKVDNPFVDLRLDYVQESRSVVYVLSGDAIQRGQDGDHDGAAETCQAILNTARSFKDQPFLISQLVRVAEHAIAVAAIERAIGQGEISEANLKKLQELLEREAAEDSLANAMRGERAGAHQMVQMLRQRKASFSQITANMGGRPSGFNIAVDMFPGIILGSYPDYLRMMNEQVRAAKLKDVERAEAMRQVEDKAKKNRTILSSMILPATIKVSMAAERGQANLRCAAVAVAVERFRVKNERWPQALEEVVKAGLLKEIPKDPYDGKALRYKRTLTGAIVYSIGPDKTDNGGTLNRSSPMAPNIDYGFELWQPSSRGVPPVIQDEDKK